MERIDVESISGTPRYYFILDAYLERILPDPIYSGGIGNAF
jgi:hypothetical protein